MKHLSEAAREDGTIDREAVVSIVIRLIGDDEPITRKRRLIIE